MGDSWSHANGATGSEWAKSRGLLDWHLAGDMQMGQLGMEGA